LNPTRAAACRFAPTSGRLRRNRWSPSSESASSLGKLYEGIKDFHLTADGGSVLLFLEEAGGREIPATRLSDGTLRYLCPLAILLHPEPTRLMVIEETELGLHPDVIPHIAELLVKASEHTQLVVTTHSRGEQRVTAGASRCGGLESLSRKVLPRRPLEHAWVSWGRGSTQSGCRLAAGGLAVRFRSRAHIFILCAVLIASCAFFTFWVLYFSKTLTNRSPARSICSPRDLSR